MPNIAIIGTNGAGKTVFITILARHLNERPVDDFVLDPEPKTFKYIEKNWRALNHWEWPGHTTAGNPVDLRWKFTLSMSHGPVSGEMQVIDAPGHDIRSIFADDNVTALDAMPAAQKSLAEYCRDADVAVFVADLNDYIPKPDGEEVEDETILKSAMDFLRKHSKKYCLILTKEDLFRDFIAQEGGLESVAAKYLKSVYRSHLKSGIPCFPISCVNKTETLVDGESIRTVPTPGFGSDGLEPFVEWLVASVGSMLPPPPPPPPPSLGQKLKRLLPILCRIAVFLVFLVALWFGYIEPKIERRRNEEQDRIKHQEDAAVRNGISGGIEPSLFHNDVWLRNNSSVTMTNIHVVVVAQHNGNEIDRADLTLQALNSYGNWHRWSGVLWIPKSHFSGGYSIFTVSCDQLFNSITFTNRQ